jgi:hypothetical protein
VSFSVLLVLTCIALGVVGCGSGGASPADPTVADFSLSVSSGSVALTAGSGSQQVSVSATAINGFSGTVSVAISGLPAGVTASPSSLNLMPGVAQTVTLTAGANAVAGSGTVTLTGTSGSISHSIPLALSVTMVPAQDFSLSASPASVALTAGAGSQQVSVSAAAINGFSGTIAVAISGLPAGVTATPSSLSLIPGTPQSITLTAGVSASASSSTVTLSGTSGSLSHTASFALNVSVVPAPDFSLSASPSAANISAGGAGAAIVLSVTAINGFSSSVNIALSGLPNGVTATPSSPTLQPGTPQTVTFAASSSAASGSAVVTVAGTARSIAHSTTVTLNIAAAQVPDFSLSVSPANLSITTGVPGQQVAVSAAAVNGFSGTVNVSIAGLPAGVTASPSTLTLTPGTAQSITFTAAANAAVGVANVSMNGQAGSLSHSSPLALTVSAPTGNDATTYHYDNARTGLNPKETILTPANVKSATFGKLNLISVDGKVDGEPLYLSAVTINGQTHNVLYVVTEHDSIYAFDADNGTQLWKVSALKSGETTGDDHNCNQITPEIGITSTPVIDRRQGTNGTIFVVAMSKDGSGGYHHRIHALDITTGAEIAGSPTEISGSYPGTGANSSGGKVIFAPGPYAERVGLLLLNQTIYLGWTSHCDQNPYTGWVMGYSESTLQQTQIINLTPNGSEGSIWMSGAGLAADTSGSIYFLGANGTFDTTFNANGFPINGDYGNAILKLSTANNSLAVADYFEPFNTVAESNADIDLGSGGALLLPDVTDSSGKVRHLIVGAGKDKNIYVGDRDNLGKYNPADNSNLYQVLPNALPNGAWSMPAYFNNTVYYGGVSDVLKAYPIVSARLSATPSSKSATSFGYPGATPSISANGTSNGIVWALESGTGSSAVLHAYDATNLANELYNSTQAANGRDSFGNGNKFITPMIINGKVYVGTPNGVAIFGLLP